MSISNINLFDFYVKSLLRKPRPGAGYKYLAASRRGVEISVTGSPLRICRAVVRQGNAAVSFKGTVLQSICLRGGGPRETVCMMKRMEILTSRKILRQRGSSGWCAVRHRRGIVHGSHMLALHFYSLKEIIKQI